MAHLIDTSVHENGAAFFADKAAWHGLGTVVDGAQTSADAIRLAGLNWSVSKRPLRTFRADGSQMDVPDEFAIVRDDTESVLSVMGDGYQVLQNIEAFEFMDSVIGETNCRYESAGSLKDGRRIWLLARLPKDLQVGSDRIVPYALLGNSHDGSLAVTVAPTTVRVVCNNTLTLALSNASETATGLKIRHSGSLSSKIGAAKRALGLIAKRVDTFQEEIEALARVSMKESQVLDLVGKVFPRKIKPAAVQPETPTMFTLDDVFAATEQKESGRQLAADIVSAESERERKRFQEICDHVLTNFNNAGNSQPGVAGTAWAAFNAVTEYADHQRGTRGSSDQDRADNRMYSNWFGSSNEVKQVAYVQALALTN